MRAGAARQVYRWSRSTRAQADISRSGGGARRDRASIRPALVVNAAAYTKVDLAETERGDGVPRQRGRRRESSAQACAPASR